MHPRARPFAQSLPRGVAVAMALLALVAQLAGLAHESLAPHTLCPEHGEWIEAEQGASVVVAGAPVEVAGPSVASALPAALHGHEHCALMAHRLPVPVVERIAVTAVEVPVAEAVSSEQEVTPSRRALLLLAPKASPPA